MCATTFLKSMTTFFLLQLVTVTSAKIVSRIRLSIYIYSRAFSPDKTLSFYTVMLLFQFCKL